MAHTCPTCGIKCHCNGDIDDLILGEEQYCSHCDSEDDDWDPDEDLDMVSDE